MIPLEHGTRGWEGALAGLAPGLYDIEAQAIGGSPPPVREIVEII